MAAALKDRYGLPLSTHSQQAAACYIEGIDCSLAFGLGAQQSLEAAIAADAHFALAHIALARELQYRGQAKEAQARKATALTCLEGASRREVQHVQVLAKAVEGDGPGALALVYAHLAEFPRDVVVLKQADGPFGLLGFGGSLTRLEENFALLDGLAQVYGDDWWFLSAYGFAHNELGRHEEARRLIQRSLDRHPASGHAAHAMAHVYFETGDHGSGAAFLQAWLLEFPRQAQIYSHLTWHRALCELAQGQTAQVADLYTATLKPDVCPGAPLIALCDAAALIWRHELYGVALPDGSREAVAAHAKQFFGRPGITFADVHCALAYAVSGDTAALAQLATQLRARLAEDKIPAGEIAPAIVEALAAFVQGDYASTVRLLEPLAAHLVRVGGSNAQREVFEDTLLQACLRAGRYDKAATLLHTRLERRASARDAAWLAEAQAQRQVMRN